MLQASTHSHTDDLRCQHRWLGVQCLAHTFTLVEVRKSWDRTSNLPIAEQVLYLLNQWFSKSGAGANTLQGGRDVTDGEKKNDRRPVTG